MFKADIGGGLLYIIIAVGLMVLGAIEKYIKKTKEMAQPQTPVSQEEGQTGEYAPDVRKTLEDILKQMQQPTPISMEEDVEEEAQSLETIFATPEHTVPQYISNQIQRNFSKYQPIVAPQSDYIVFTEEEQTYGDFEYEFDLREAVIYSEILRRKYE